jgi:hypothetical protein
VVYYCDSSGSVASETCGTGDTCGWDSEEGYYGCVASPGGADPSGTYPQACE